MGVRVLGGRDMCILYVRRIRNISNDRDEERRRVEKQLWVFRA